MKEEKRRKQRENERERKKKSNNYLPFSAVVIAEGEHIHTLTYTIKNIKSKTGYKKIIITTTTRRRKL